MRLKITSEYYFSIFRKYFEKHNDLRKAHHTRFNHILHSALQEGFPCSVSGPAWAEEDGVLLHCRGLEDRYNAKNEPESYLVFENYKMALDGSWIAIGVHKVDAHQKEAGWWYRLKIGLVTRLITFYPKDLTMTVGMRIDTGSDGKTALGRHYELFCSPFKNPLKF